MEYIYAVRTENEMAALRIFANNYSAVVDKYISYLEKELNAENFPRSIVFCPSFDTWRNLYNERRIKAKCGGCL